MHIISVENKGNHMNITQKFHIYKAAR